MILYGMLRICGGLRTSRPTLVRCIADRPGGRSLRMDENRSRNS